MHCKACDMMLSNRENTRKHQTTGEYIQLCDSCFIPMIEEVPTVVNEVASDDCQSKGKRV